jgi:hypothetical protein
MRTNFISNTLIALLMDKSDFTEEEWDKLRIIVNLYLQEHDQKQALMLAEMPNPCAKTAA